MRSVFLVLLPSLYQNAKSSPVLIVRSELKAAPASPIAHHQCPGEPETTCGGVGEQPKHGAEGKSCNLEIPFPLQTKLRSTSLTIFTSITQGSLLCSLETTMPALLRTKIHLLQSQDQLNHHPSEQLIPYLPSLNHLKNCSFPKFASFRTLDHRDSGSVCKVRAFAGKSATLHSFCESPELTTAIQLCCKETSSERHPLHPTTTRPTLSGSC